MQRFCVSQFAAQVGLLPRGLTSVVLSLLVLAAPAVGAQMSNTEVGSVVAGGNVIWVRATNSGSVAVFMSRGYRDALARPTMVDANRLTLWTDSAKALHAPASGVADASAPSDSGLAFDRWVGTDSSGLEIKRDGSTILRLSDTPAREVVDLLARGADLTRRMSAPSRPVAVAVVAPASRPPLLTAEATVTTPAPTQTAVSLPPTPVATAPSVSAPAAQARVDSAPAQPLVPNLQPSIDPNVPSDARASSATLVSRGDGPLVGEVKVDRLPPVTNLDKHIDTPLGPFVVPAAKLVDRDTQIRYCYTELGLRYDRHLTGEVTVRVSLNSAGFADTVEVTKRTWDGVPAAEVESCMRALIEDWSFDDRQPPDSRTVELHFTLTPAMRTAATDGTQSSPQPR